jgi:hypothetical protein
MAFPTNSTVETIVHADDKIAKQDSRGTRANYVSRSPLGGSLFINSSTPLTLALPARLRFLSSMRCAAVAAAMPRFQQEG